MFLSERGKENSSSRRCLNLLLLLFSIIIIIPLFIYLFIYSIISLKQENKFLFSAKTDCL